jgi:hypothetical protein
MDMAYCRECGAELPENAKSCEKCGKEIKVKAHTPGLVVGIVLLVCGLTTLLGPLGTIIGLLIAIVAMNVKKVNE